MAGEEVGMAGEEVGMAATACTECGPNNPDMRRFDLLTKVGSHTVRRF